MHGFESHAQRAARFSKRVDAALCEVANEWYAPLLLTFVRWQRANKFAATTIGRYLVRVIDFVRFAERRGVHTAVGLPAQRPAYVRHWMRRHPQAKRSARFERRIRIGATAPTAQFLRLVTPTLFRPDVMGSYQWKRLTAVAERFLADLRDERGLREPSIRHHHYSLRLIDRFLATRHLGVQSITPRLLADLVIHLRRSMDAASARSVCSNIRVLLGWLHREGFLPRDIRKALVWPKTYRFRKVARAAKRAEISRTLRLLHTPSLVDTRDFAMLMLMTVYAWRAADVARLELSDIDWRAGLIRARGRKNHGNDTYPLEASVATALIAYLKIRPEGLSTPQVFVTTRPPYRPLNHWTPSVRASLALKKARVEVPRPGSHTLRHSTAQWMIDQGETYGSTSRLLGQKVEDSSRNYARIDIRSLRKVQQAGAEAVL